MKSSSSNRRQFIRNSSLALAATGIVQPGSIKTDKIPDRLPREVWVGTVAMEGLSAANAQDMVAKVLQVMENMLPYEPDIICLPEGFAYSNISASYTIQEIAEKVPGAVVSPFLQFAKQHHCYIICPTYIKKQDHIHIGAVLIDRQGKVAGEYLKMRPAGGEMKQGIVPGPMKPPVFETDFGRIGIQICYDIKWEEGWQKLKDAGAEIIFWPSAYAGGREITSRAWRHQIHIVTSTGKDSSRICDITGEVLAQTGRWQRNWACTGINLEKVFLPTWPSVQHFAAIQKKYGRKIKLTTFAEEEWSILESLDPKVKVADVLKDFGIPSQHQQLQEIAQMQEQLRVSD